MRLLSPFLKKLMFAQQFAMADGTIRVLGQKHVMLPVHVLAGLQEMDKHRCYAIVKNGIKATLEDCEQRIGPSSQGSLSISMQIIETLGIGRPQVVTLNNTAKSAIVRVLGADKTNDDAIVPAVLAAMFSVVFKKDVECSLVRREASYAEYTVK